MKLFLLLILLTMLIASCKIAFITIGLDDTPTHVSEIIDEGEPK